MEIIETSKMGFSYPAQEGEKSVPALKNINIQIKKGEFVSIVGKNGSGKSTLAKHFNTLNVPSEGVCYVVGYDTADESKKWEIRSNVGMVFQNPDNQIIATIVEEDVAFGPENLGMPPEQIRKEIDNALFLVGMEEYAKKEPHMLSGGQKQRVAIAGILAMNPAVIVLDEATAMLDPKGKREVMETAHRLNKEQGITIINISHFMEEVVYSDRVIVLKDGEVFMEGTPKEVFSREDEIIKAGLELPLAEQLAALLREKGVELKEGILTIEEMVVNLCPLL